jgi:hypothetical protein
MKFIEREKPHEKRLVVGSLFFLALTVRKGLTFVGCLALKRMRTSNSKISGDSWSLCAIVMSRPELPAFMGNDEAWRSHLAST